MTEEQALNKIAKLIKETVQKKLKENGSYVYGDLYNSVEPVITENGIQVKMAHYAEYVDKGTKPHMPPVSPIEKWVTKKNLNLNPWAVAINIKKFGTKAHPFLFVIDTIDITPIISEYVESVTNNLKLEDKKMTLNI